MTAVTHAAYVRRETLISMAINGTLSLLFFLIVFGRTNPVPVWGPGMWVFDFLPQSFMIALMGTLVPGAITARRLKTGVLQPSAATSRRPRALVLRALLLAMLSAVLGTGLVALLSLAIGLVTLDWTMALVLKVAYGLALAGIVTPVGLWRALVP